MEVVAINDLADTATLAHLLKYDSVHGRFPGTIENNSDHLVVNDNKVLVFCEEDPGRLPWKSLNIDVVIESTGKFVSRPDAIKHVTEAGARKVIISAPLKMKAMMLNMLCWELMTKSLIKMMSSFRIPPARPIM